MHDAYINIVGLVDDLQVFLEELFEVIDKVKKKISIFIE